MVETAAQRLRLAMDMFETGVAMQRQRLRRQQPGASEAELDAGIAAWLSARPGAEFGDAPGRPVDRVS